MLPTSNIPCRIQSPPVTLDKRSMLQTHRSSVQARTYQGTIAWPPLLRVRAETRAIVTRVHTFFLAMQKYFHFNIKMGKLRNAKLGVQDAESEHLYPPHARARCTLRAPQRPQHTSPATRTRYTHYRERSLSTRWISRSISRFAADARLSNSFLPWPMPTRSFTRLPSLK